MGTQVTRPVVGWFEENALFLGQVGWGGVLHSDDNDDKYDSFLTSTQGPQARKYRQVRTLVPPLHNL